MVLAQLFIGLGWLRAATEKLIDPSWWAGEGVSSFLADHQGLTVGWYQPFVDLVVQPNVMAIGLIVMIAQLLAGLSLVSGRHTAVGLGVGIFLNLHFVAAGAVNPSAFYLVIQGALALWLAEQAFTHRRTAPRLSVAAVSGTVMAVISLPFVSTLHPADVIEDPAVMLVLVGALTAACCELAVREVTRRRAMAVHPSTTCAT